MKVYMNTGGLAQTNAYLIADEAARVAAIVDAPQDTTEILLGIARQQRYEVEYLLLTHGHWDHISDHKVVTDTYPKVRVMIHRDDEPKLEHPGSEFIDLPYEIPPRRADGYLEDGGKIHVGGITLAAMHTPGHSAGHVALYSNDHGTLLAGDLIMAGAVGRYDLSDGDIVALKKSLRRIMLLPDSVKILSGHGPATTVGRERRGNFFLLEHGLTQGE